MLCCRWCTVVNTNPVAPSTLNEPTATLRCCAVRFTWLENGNTMNQRLYVQRPSVLTGCFIWLIMQRGKKKKKKPHTHTQTNTPLYPHPSHQKHWCFKLMLTAYETISYGNEYCRCFLVFFSVGEDLLVGRSVGRSGVSALPSSLLCIVVKVLPVSWRRVKFYF